MNRRDEAARFYEYIRGVLRVDYQSFEDHESHVDAVDLAIAELDEIRSRNVTKTDNTVSDELDEWKRTARQNEREFNAARAQRDEARTERDAWRRTADYQRGRASDLHGQLAQRDRRIAELEAALRGEVVQYGITSKSHAAYGDYHYSLCGLCEAKGEDEEEPQHKSDCLLSPAPAQPATAGKWEAEQEARIQHVIELLRRATPEQQEMAMEKLNASLGAAPPSPAAREATNVPCRHCGAVTGLHGHLNHDGWECHPCWDKRLASMRDNSSNHGNDLPPFIVTAEQYEKIMEMIQSPAAPTEALRALFRKREG